MQRQLKDENIGKLVLALKKNKNYLLINNEIKIRLVNSGLNRAEILIESSKDKYKCILYKTTEPVN